MSPRNPAPGERKEFAEKFVVDYLRKNGEACDLFFAHWISHRYPEITQQAINHALVGMMRSKRLRVTCRESTGDFNLVRFLALA